MFSVASLSDDAWHTKGVFHYWRTVEVLGVKLNLSIADVAFNSHLV